jgi:hypothetical protein
MTSLVTYRDISGTCSDTFKRHNKSQLTGICGWSGGEFDTLVDRSLQWQVSASVDEPKSTRSTPSRRNRSAKTYNDTVRSNYRTHKSGSLSDVSTTHRMKHQQPKRSASTHACTGSRLPSSSPSSTLSKQQFLHQSVKNIQFEFAHFEDWKDHIEHYRNTVTNKVQSKYVEHNAPGFTARRQASLHENSDVYGRKLLNRQETNGELPFEAVASARTKIISKWGKNVDSRNVRHSGIDAPSVKYEGRAPTEPTGRTATRPIEQKLSRGGVPKDGVSRYLFTSKNGAKHPKHPRSLAGPPASCFQQPRRNGRNGDQSACNPIVGDGLFVISSYQPLPSIEPR